MKYYKKNTNNKFSVSLLVVRFNIKFPNSKTKLSYWESLDQKSKTKFTASMR